MDLGCQRTVRKLEGKDSHTLQYAVQYSNDEKIWKSLTSEDEEYYDKDLKVSVTTKKIIHHGLVLKRFAFHCLHFFFFRHSKQAIRQ